MLYFLIGFVSGVYSGQEYDLPKFKPILSLLYFKIKEYFDKLEKVNKQKSQREIIEEFTQTYTESEDKNINLKKINHNFL